MKPVSFPSKHKHLWWTDRPDKDMNRKERNMRFSFWMYLYAINADRIMQIVICTDQSCDLADQLTWFPLAISSSLLHTLCMLVSPASWPLSCNVQWPSPWVTQEHNSYEDKIKACNANASPTTWQLTTSFPHKQIQPHLPSEGVWVKSSHNLVI